MVQRIVKTRLGFTDGSVRHTHMLKIRLEMETTAPVREIILVDMLLKEKVPEF